MTVFIEPGVLARRARTTGAHDFSNSQYTNGTDIYIYIYMVGIATSAQDFGVPFSLTRLGFRV